MDSRVETLVRAIDNLRNFSHRQDDLVAVKNALNSIFLKDAKCENFIYTINTDKVPFGCVVMPKIFPDTINNFMIVGDNIRFDSYEVEIDSKLFDYGLTNEDVVAIILYNIYHLVCDFSPANRVREMIDAWLANRGTNIVIKDSIQFQAILAFGLYDAINQITSCLYLPDDVTNDPFLDSLELDNFESALQKLYKEIPGCENEITRQPKLTMLDWCLRLYTDVDKERVPALHLLDKAKKLTASVLYINKMNAVINALNRIDTSLYTESAKLYITEAKRRGFFVGLKYAGLQSIEDDLYEYIIRVKNAETDDEVFYCLKQINARLAIISDYIREERESGASEKDLEKWINLKIQYMDIRDKLVKNANYKKKAKYGVFVDYNALDKLDDEEE